MSMISTGISFNLPSESRSSLRELSFSSYLNADEEAFVLKLAEENRSRLDSSMSARNELVYRGRMDTEDTEIDVFGAEKYFNEGTNYSQRIASKDIWSSQAKEDPLKVISTKEKPHMAKRSLQSESSWSSWSALLHPISRNQQPRKARKVHRKSFLARIGFCCSCNDKTSLEIYDCISENVYDKNIKSQPNSGFKKDCHCKGFDELGVALNADDHFSFPVPNPETPNQPVEMKLPDEEDKAKRNLLEVFTFPRPESGKNRSLYLDEIHPRTKQIKISGSSDQMYSDIDSDASSDLFEIESLSQNANYPSFSWQESDGTSS